MQPNNPSTLSLSQLIDRLNAEQFKGVDTNIIGLEHCANGDIELTITSGATVEEIEDLKEQLADGEKEYEVLEAKLETQAEKNNLLQELIDSANQQFADIQCGDVTAKDLRDRAQDAEAEVERWKTIARENKEAATRAMEEVASLRRKKGVEPWVYRNINKIISLIDLANSMNERKTDIEIVARYGHELMEEIKKKRS